MKIRLKTWLEAHPEDDAYGSHGDAILDWLEGYFEEVLAPVLYGLWYVLVIGLAVHGSVIGQPTPWLVAIGLGVAPFAAQWLLIEAMMIDDEREARRSHEALKRARDARDYDRLMGRNRA